MARSGAWDTVAKLTMQISEIIFEKALKITVPDGAYKVTNLYVDPTSGKLIIEYEDNPIEKEGG